LSAFYGKKQRAASVHETHHHENLDRNLDGAERKREVMRPRIVIVVVVHQSLSPSPTLYSDRMGGMESGSKLEKLKENVCPCSSIHPFFADVKLFTTTLSV